MKQQKEGAMIASTEAVEAIRDFLTDFYNVPSIYKTIALAYSELNRILVYIPSNDVENIANALEQCIMVTELLEPFSNNDTNQRTE